MNIDNITKKARRGFTLVEVLTVIAISIALLFVLTQTYVSYNQSFGYVMASTDATQSAAIIIKETSSAILQANAVLASRSFSGTTYTSGPSTLVLSIPSVDAFGNILTNKYDYVAFYSDGTAAYKKLEADPSSARVSSTRQLTSALQSLTFSYDSGDFGAVRKVEVNVSTQRQVKGQTASSQLKQQNYLRNK